MSRLKTNVMLTERSIKELKKILIERDITFPQLAQRLGVTRQYLSVFITQTKPINPTFAERISEIIGDSSWFDKCNNF